MNTNQKKKPDYSGLEWQDPAYIDLYESREPVRASGPKTAEVLFDISRLCTKKSDKSDWIRCLASKTCKQTWGGHKRAKNRIVGHAANCKALPIALQLACIKELACGSSGPTPDVSGKRKEPFSSTLTPNDQPTSGKPSPSNYCKFSEIMKHGNNSTDWPSEHPQWRHWPLILTNFWKSVNIITLATKCHVCLID